MYRWVMQSYRRFGQAFVLDVYNTRGRTAAAAAASTDGGGGVGFEEAIDDAQVEENDGLCYDDGCGQSQLPPSVGSLTGDGLEETSGIVEKMLARLREFSTEFERLELAVERYETNASYVFTCSFLRGGRICRRSAMCLPTAAAATPDFDGVFVPSVLDVRVFFCVVH